MTSNIIYTRISIVILTIVAILGTASSCSIPGFFNSTTAAATTYGLIKKDPGVRADGFVRANAVVGLDGNTDNQGLSNLSATKIVRINKDKLYILTKEKGLFRTQNGGQTWSRIYLIPVGSSNSDTNNRNKEINTQIAQNDALIITDFAVDILQPQVLYIAVTEGNFGKIYQSLDEGNNFKEIYSEVEQNIPVLFLAIDPLNSSNIFAILQEGALLRTTDSGLSWEKVRSFKDTPVQIGFVPEFNNLFFVLFASDGLAFSKDTGATWEILALTKAPSEIGENQPKDGLDISFSQNAKFGKYEKIVPITAGITYTTDGKITNPSGKNTWLLIADKQMWYSQNAGNDFKKLVLPLQSEQANIYDIAFDPNSGLNRILASVDNRLFITTNQGKSWNTQDNINLSNPIGNISQILIEKENTEIIYLTLINPKATRNNGLFSF